MLRNGVKHVTMDDIATAGASVDEAVRARAAAFDADLAKQKRFDEKRRDFAAQVRVRAVVWHSCGICVRV